MWYRRVLSLCAIGVCYRRVLSSCAIVVWYRRVLSSCVIVMCYRCVLSLCILRSWLLCLGCRCYLSAVLSAGADIRSGFRELLALSVRRLRRLRLSAGGGLLRDGLCCLHIRDRQVMREPWQIDQYVSNDNPKDMPVFRFQQYSFDLFPSSQVQRWHRLHDRPQAKHLLADHVEGHQSGCHALHPHRLHRGQSLGRPDLQILGSWIGK